MTSRWTPSEYLLDGHFCPIEDIRGVLEAATASLGATSALLLPADRLAVHRSLFLPVPSDGPGARLVKMLQSTDPEVLSRRLPDWLTPSAHRKETATRYPNSYRRLQGELGKLARHHHDPTLAAWIEDDQWRPAVPDPRVVTAALFPAVLVLMPQTHNGPVDVSAHLVQMTEMVNGTAQASVRRDSAIMLQVDRGIDPQTFLAPGLEIEDASKSLVGLARDITNSDEAVCYLRSPEDPQMFKLAAQSESRANVSPPDVLHTERPRRVGEVAIERHRALQAPPGVPDMPGLQSTWGGTPSASDVELATPIPGPLASPKTPAVGVLVVRRSSKRPGDSYGAYDMALLRNVALRAALLFTSSEVSNAASVLAPRHSQTDARTSERHRADWRQSDDMPRDLVRAAPRVSEVLVALRRLTGSHSATFRVALPSMETVHSSGLALLRVCSSPGGRLYEDPEVQTFEDAGLNWDVVVSGVLQYVPWGAPLDPRVLNVRLGTEAELSLPVTVERRLVGVVNLESPLARAYDGVLATARALVEQVALALTDARLSLILPFYEHASEILRRGHEFSAEASAIRALEVGPPAETKLLEIADRIDQRARELRQVPVGTSPGARRLPDLVRSCVKLIEIDEVTWGIGTTTPEAFVELSPETATTLKNAINDVLQNAKRRRTGPLLVELDDTVWAGVRHEVATFSHTVGSQLGAQRAADAFRVPIVQPRPVAARSSGVTGGSPRTVVENRLGAFTAGSLIRGLAGDAYLATDGVIVRVKIMYPASR